MAVRLHGIIDERGDWDEEGYRSYTYVYLVQSNSVYDGPAAVSACAGLPLPGALYLVGNDNDPWAWCRPRRSIQKHQDRQGDSLWWTVEVNYSNRPPDTKNAAQRDPASNNGQGVNNPLLEPPKISIRGVKDREATVVDLYGRVVMNSAWELLQGPQMEFDVGRASVRIEHNVIDAQTALCDAAMNCLNNAPMWGLPRRCVKLSNWGADPKYYNNFLKYYTRFFEFETDKRTWDRYIPDVGTKALQGKYNFTTGLYETELINGEAPDPDNPQHFKQWIDRYGQPGKVVLNGFGMPAGAVVTTDGYSVSIQNGNLNHALDDSDWWAPFHGDNGQYDNTQDYGIGDVVDFFGDIYIATDYQRIGVAPPAAGWLLLPSGVTSAGNYSAAMTYSLGAKVRDTTKTGVGYIHVKKYPEVNFFAFGGIPAIL